MKNIVEVNRGILCIACFMALVGCTASDADLPQREAVSSNAVPDAASSESPREPQQPAEVATSEVNDESAYVSESTSVDESSYADKETDGEESPVPERDGAAEQPSFEKRSTGKLSDRFPNITLYTQDNKPIRFYDDLVKEWTVVINFMYTTCTGI